MLDPNVDCVIAGNGNERHETAKSNDVHTRHRLYKNLSRSSLRFVACQSIESRVWLEIEEKRLQV